MRKARPGKTGADTRSTTPEMSRRNLLRNCVYAVGGIIATVLGYPAVRYFIYPALRGRQETTWTQIAQTSEVPVGVPTFITYEERLRDGWVVSPISKGAWVVTKDGRSFTAFDPHCTHLGCAYYWNPDRKFFLCPCHDGVFDIDGNVVSGPPPRPLDRLESKVSEGTLLVGMTIKSTNEVD
ncbi:MAG: ubiquinol-cytochrome c reductase iron-sulfur subunit [Chloroflexota bacterium]